MRHWRWLGWGVLCLGTIGIGLATLGPLPAQAEQSAATHLFCVLCGTAGAADFLANILLFLPLGLAAGLLGQGPWGATALALSTSLAVESLQLLGIAGRDPALGDLLANGLGGLVGQRLGAFGPVLLFPSRRLAWRLVLGVGLAEAAVLGVVSWGLQPRLPLGPWFGQWAEYGPEPGWLLGRVEAASLGGGELSHGLLADTEGRRRDLQDRPIRLATRVRPTQQTERELQIVAVGNPEERFLSLRASGEDLRFQAPMRSQTLRLRTPVFRLGGGFRVEADRPLVLEGTWTSGTVEIRSRPGQGPAKAGHASLGWWDGWMLLYPWDVRLGRSLDLLRLAWVLGLVAPLGWWAWRAVRPERLAQAERVEGG